MNISIKQAAEDDWRVLRQIRLKALQTDPLVFGSNYEKESKLTENDWRARLQTVDSAVFLLFETENPVGMTGVSVFRDDPANKTAIFWGSWLAPDFRLQGVSKLMYQARIDWAKAHPTIEKIIVAHRASNLASKCANQKHGFVFTHTAEIIWADGVAEDVVSYELKLEK